jgi:hypothetical protein
MTPELIIRPIEKIQKARLMFSNPISLTPENLRPSAGTETTTCIAESTRDNVANVKASGARMLCRYGVVDQCGRE